MLEPIDIEIIKLFLALDEESKKTVIENLKRMDPNFESELGELPSFQEKQFSGN